MACDERRSEKILQLIMKIKIIIVILFIFFSSCKIVKNISDEQSSKNTVTKIIKVVDEEHNPIKVIFAIAVLANYDETHCDLSFSGMDAIFQINIDTTLIKPESYIEIVAWKYDKKEIPLLQFLKIKDEIILTKTANKVEKEEYDLFVSKIRGCKYVSDIDFDD